VRPLPVRRGPGRIPGAELVVFERSGHFPYVEEPDLFFGTVRSWLARTGH
jgi:proline iminopeptidase